MGKGGGGLDEEATERSCAEITGSRLEGPQGDMQGEERSPSGATRRGADAGKGLEGKGHPGAWLAALTMPWALPKS